MSHTILLMQTDSNLSSRKYSDYESVSECMEGKYNNYPKIDINWINQTIMPPSYSLRLKITLMITTYHTGVCKMYEDDLKRKYRNRSTITYDISDLFDYIDKLSDLSCLVYHKSTEDYMPFGKDWIKERIYLLLGRQAIN